MILDKQAMLLPVTMPTHILASLTTPSTCRQQSTLQRSWQTTLFDATEKIWSTFK